MSNILEKDQFESGRLAKLMGGRVVEVGVYRSEADAYDPEQDWPALVIELPDGTRVAVVANQDPEGNGPGHLELAELELAEVPA